MNAQSPTQKLKILQTVYTALMTMLVLFAGVTTFLVYSGSIEPSEGSEIITYIPFGLFLVTIPAGNYLFKKFMSAIPTDPTVNVDFAKYQTAIIIRSALYEVSGLFGAVAALVSGEYYPLGVTGLVVIVFLMNFPTPFRVQRDMGLSKAEVDKLSTN